MKKLLLTLAFSFLCLFAYAASPVTYYFDAYDSGGEEWDFAPEKMVDGLATDASHAYDNTGSNNTQLLTGNTCAGTNLGTITKVEIRGYQSTLFDDPVWDYIHYRPVFSGSSDGDEHYEQVNTGNGDWGSYFDITSDTNHPETWSWSDVQNLDCDVRSESNDASPAVGCSLVEIRVTYTTGAAARRRIIMVE